MDHKLILEEAKSHLIESKAIHEKLQIAFGDTIPVDETVKVSAANLALMNAVVGEYAQLKISLLTMMDAKEINCGEFTLEDYHADIFKLGISTALDLVGSPCISSWSNNI